MTVMKRKTKEPAAPLKRKPKAKVVVDETPPPKSPDQERLDTLVDYMYKLKEDAAEFTTANRDAFLKAEDEARALMHRLDIKKWDSESTSATLVEPEGAEVDWTAVESMLTEEEWHLVSERTGSKTRLEDALVKGLVPKGVAKHVKPKAIKPSIRTALRRVK